MSLPRKIDVYETQYVAQATASNREPLAIFCCVQYDGGQIDYDELDQEVIPAACSVEFSVDRDYRRVFLSGTIGAINIEYTGDGDPTGLARFFAYIDVVGAQIAVPQIDVTMEYGNLHRESISITSAIDLPFGDYEARLLIVPAYSDTRVYYFESANQAIVGQVVNEQVCWRTGGGNG